MTTSISHEHLDNHCRMGQGVYCCRYILLDRTGFHCAKHTDWKATLDHRVEAGLMVAQGDNCPGLGAPDYE